MSVVILSVVMLNVRCILSVVKKPIMLSNIMQSVIILRHYAECRSAKPKELYQMKKHIVI